MSHIRVASNRDWNAIWSILEPTIRAGETYALPRQMSESQARAYWMASDRETFIAETDGRIEGTYYIRPNQLGGGDHVANCGYMTAASSVGRGVATRMCIYSVDYARAAGYRAMQFNFVVSTNQRAVRLWQSLGFEITGKLPAAFKLPSGSYVDALVMFKTL